MCLTVHVPLVTCFFTDESARPCVQVTMLILYR